MSGGAVTAAFQPVYGCGNRKVGPCVPWQRFVDLSDERFDLEQQLARIAALHTPRPAESNPHGVTQRCTNCVAGYDPRTGDLVFAAWPCTTAAVLAQSAEGTEDA